MDDPKAFRGLQVWASATEIVCQRFRLVERYPEPVPASAE
jgi:hypothetical protein